MAISPAIRFLFPGWHVKHGEPGGHAVIPRQPQSAPLARDSPGPGCPWGIWITGNYFTFVLELFWQSSAVSFISSFLACKCPFYSSYSYRIYSSPFLKLLIPSSSFLFKLVPFHFLGISCKAKYTFRGWNFVSSSNYLMMLVSIIPFFLSSAWQLCPFCHTAFHAYEELCKMYYYLLLYASLNPFFAFTPTSAKKWLVNPLISLFFPLGFIGSYFEFESLWDQAYLCGLTVPYRLA